MEEQQVTVESTSYPLENPFSVIATQNPVGASGTQLLPDSQMDRFTVKISMGYPDFDSECQIILNRSTGNPLDNVKCVVTKEKLIQMQKEVKAVFVHKDMASYIVSLINATRNNKLIARGASPRATLSLTDMAKAVAYADNRNFFEPWEPKRVDNFYTPEFHKISLKYEENAIANYHMLRLWIFNKYDPSTIIGCISFSDMKKGALLNCQLSYKIDQNHTRQGFATEALNYAIPLMFEGYQFHKIDALVHPKNTTSIHLLENLNFELEGTSKAYINLTISILFLLTFENYLLSEGTGTAFNT